MTPPHPSSAEQRHPDPRPEPLHPTPAPESAPAKRRPDRRFFAFAAAILAAAAVAGYGVHWYLTRGDQGTDDAVVEADVVPLAPRVGGQVARVLVQENQVVRSGQVVAQIDDADYAAKVREAEANLATAQAQASASVAQVTAAEAGLRRAGVDARKTALDLERAERLRAGEAIAPEALDNAKAAGDSSKAGVENAKAQYAAARAQVNLAAAKVKSAQAALDLARLQLSYTKIAAPADGYVSKLTVHDGQLVSTGQPLFQFVPLQTYVVANFKETQVGAMRPGQIADIEIDAYPGRKLEGLVDSLSGGTGARFSLIPPDNASGNFVKVVERVPVRIAWAKPPPSNVLLRAGLSAYVTVHTR
jgi:membrane fusion protein (multidrug efflux system)